ncbi:MAG: beta-ketoacyl-ACP synthase III [Anaerolineae bacterium]|nr:beta-ketoacyl-ACP synthase III [Anaerolineae bacterium]
MDDKRNGQVGKSANAGFGRPRYAHITGWGMAVPDRVVTNHELAQIVDTSDEWIRTRTGIRQRHIAVDPRETSATLGARAARAALEVADFPASRLDLILCATSSPEHIFPSTASLIQDALGAVHAGACDLSAACSGFVYALSLASSMIVSGQADSVLVVGAEVLSRFVDWSDRTTCVLFGDGAGALLLQASPVPGGVLSSVLGSDGSGSDLLIVPAGGSRRPATLETVASGQHFIKMDGRAVFRFATHVMAEATRQALEKAGLGVADVDLVIPHQANERIIRSSMKQLGLSEDKVFINIDRYGNTSTASIPIAVCEAVAAGRLRPNDNVVMVGFGAGLTWAATAVRWAVPMGQEVPRWRAGQRSAGYSLARVRSRLLRLSRKVEGTLAGEQNEGLGKIVADRLEEWRRARE